MTTTARTVLRRLVGVAASAAVAGAASITLATPADAAPKVWDRVAACESSGDWDINTGNGYYGGLQFSPTTWREFGGTRYASMAHKATKSEQIAIARRVLAVQGPGAWPVCSKRAGLTKSNGGADRNATTGSSSKQSSSSTKSTKKSSTKKSSTKKAATKKSTKKSSTKATSGKRITVRPGDTLSKLAKVHRVKGGWQRIADVNNLANPNYLRIGQKLLMPS